MWMVRAGEGAFLIDDFKSKNYVSIGWNKIGNISDVKRKDKIKKLVEEADYYKKKLQVSVAAGQISRFLLDFEKGDYVITYACMRWGVTRPARQIEGRAHYFFRFSSIL